MTNVTNVLRATVSGSFHRHMDAITRAVHELAALSIRVLSPAEPRIVAAQGEFLFVASDRARSVRLVQDRHLDCIRASTFLWLVCPDGYVGVSAALEIGAAGEAGVPIFATHAPHDITLREYVTVVPSISEAVRRVQAKPRVPEPESILVDPYASVEEAHAVLEQVAAALNQSNGPQDLATAVYRDLEKVRTMLATPAILQ
jgi:hypothetical protein